jgi:ribosomal protein S18 acetylase RimI-like enzyme
MQASERTAQTSIKFVWASPNHLADVWQVQENAGTKWPHQKSFFDEALQHDRALLAFDGETPVAYLVFQILWGNTAFASLAQVLPDYQRKGIGKSMVKLLEERLVALGFTSYVASSESVNAKTKRFLPDLGLVRIGDLQMQHGVEVFYLKKLS